MSGEFVHLDQLKYEGPHTTEELIRLLKEAKEAMRPWATGAEPEDLFRRRTWEMAAAHATFFLSLAHILEIGPSVPEMYATDFVGYCLQWVLVVEHHHFWEEELYYPQFARGVHTDEIVKEHALFKGGLTEMEGYLMSCLPKDTPYGHTGEVITDEKTQEFRMEKLESIVWSFIIPFISHLTAEIEYLHPDRLRAAQTLEEMTAISEWTLQYFKTQLPLDTFMTWLVLHAPAWAGFPPAPWFVTGFCRWVMYWRWRRWWQFAPRNPE